MAAKIIVWVIRNPKAALRILLLLLALTTALVACLVLLIAIPVTLIAGASAPSQHAEQDIPEIAFQAYTNAESFGCEGLTWHVIAGIGKVESNHGYGNISTNGDVSPQVFGPVLNGSGVGGNITPFPANQWAGKWGTDNKWLQGLGPMQFLAPTWSAISVDGNADGIKDPHNIFDAAAGTATELCRGVDSLTNIEDLEAAILRYNRSTQYVADVLHHATLYGTHYVLGDAKALLNNPHITFTMEAEQDLTNGIVDPRLIALLNDLTHRYDLFILNFRTGHGRCAVLTRPNTGPDCHVSNHWLGRATDIIAVTPRGQARENVSVNNTTAKELVALLAEMPSSHPYRPEEVGSPFPQYESEPGHFTNDLHLHHIHIGFNTEFTTSTVPLSEASSLGMIWPVTPPIRITSKYGMRIHPVHGTKKLHTGMDISAATGEPIRAAASGTVTYAGNRGGYGKTVVIDHGNNLSTLYAHLSSINVNIGQQITQGTELGQAGQTGTATGPHLHLEVRLNNLPIDPTPFMPTQ